MPEYTLSLRLADSYNRKSRKTFTSVATLADFATARTSADALIADFKAITGLEVLVSWLSERQTETDAPAAGSSVDPGATLSVRKTNQDDDTLKWPAPLVSYINPDGTIDISNSLITDYVANFLDTTGDWTFSDGEQVLSINSGVLDR